MPTREVCSTCLYYHQGTCRRYPPVVVPVQPGLVAGDGPPAKLVASYPPVTDAESVGCGEWEEATG